MGEYDPSREEINAMIDRLLGESPLQPRRLRRPVHSIEIEPTLSGFERAIAKIKALGSFVMSEIVDHVMTGETPWPFRKK